MTKAIRTHHPMDVGMVGRHQLTCFGRGMQNAPIPSPVGPVFLLVLKTLHGDAAGLEVAATVLLVVMRGRRVTQILLWDAATAAASIASRKAHGATIPRTGLELILREMTTGVAACPGGV